MKNDVTLFRYSVIIMEYVGSRNLHRLLIETPEKIIGRFAKLMYLNMFS